MAALFVLDHTQLSTKRNVIYLEDSKKVLSANVLNQNAMKMRALNQQYWNEGVESTVLLVTAGQAPSPNG